MPAKTHGRSCDPIYNVWQRMIARCHKPYSSSFPAYGGRGIKVCDRWLNSFEAFLADMGDPSNGMQLDRIDNEGDYEPGNCRWATRSENARNRRSNHLITANGETGTLAEWAEKTGLSSSTIRSRLNRGKTAEQAIAHSHGGLS